MEMTDYEDYENNLAFPPTTDRTQSTIELVEKIEKLTKQLEIAVACLKHYADENFYLFPTYRNGHERAEKAIKQIKELEK